MTAARAFRAKTREAMMPNGIEVRFPISSHLEVEIAYFISGHTLRGREVAIAFLSDTFDYVNLVRE
jgi:hypothetical protein